MRDTSTLCLRALDRRLPELLRNAPPIEGPCKNPLLGREAAAKTPEPAAPPSRSNAAGAGALFSRGEDASAVGGGVTPRAASGHSSPSASRHRLRMHFTSISSTGALLSERLCLLPPPALISLSFATSAARVHRPTVGRVGAATIIELDGNSSQRSSPLPPVSGSEDTSSACVATNFSPLELSLWRFPEP